MIEVECPKCRLRVQYADQMASLETNCQACGTWISIPHPKTNDSPAARMLQKMVAAGRQVPSPVAPPPLGVREAGGELARVLGAVMKMRGVVVSRLGLDRREPDYRNYAEVALLFYGLFAVLRLCAEKMRDDERRREVVTAMFEAWAEPEVRVDLLTQAQTILARFGHAYASEPQDGAL